MLWTLLIGAVFGALARLFMKGDQNIGIIWTVILGALGGLAGGWIAKDLLHWGNFTYLILGVIMSVIFISAYLMLTQGRKR